MFQLPQHATAGRFRVPMLVALILVHGISLAAPFTFTWAGLITLIVMYYATGCLGITLCYHRLLSHRSYKTHKIVKYFLMLCGTLALQGDPKWWVSGHRLHHRESDQPLDPHSPTVSFAWAHFMWLLYDDPRITQESLDRSIPDLINDPWAKFLEKFFLPVNLGVIALTGVLGYFIGGWETAISMVVWGGFLRIAVVWHVTWLVNSATHVWGYKNYTTRDDSRNNWVVALLAFGEGWHNNHHAMPGVARNGQKWWEFDLTYCIIKAMSLTGLAWKLQPVVVAPAQVMEPASLQKQMAASGKG